MFFRLKFYLELNSVSLDPDEDKRDATIFDGLKNYMLNEMTDEECQHFKTITLRNLAKRAQSLKSVRPPRGLNFSLQQQRMLQKFCRFPRTVLFSKCCLFSTKMINFFFLLSFLSFQQIK